MTFTLTVAPPFPLLSLALWIVSLAVSVRSTCYLAMFVIGRREEMYGHLLGWQGVAFWLTSATFLSVEAWQFGVPLACVAAVCAALWRRERERERA